MRPIVICLEYLYPDLDSNDMTNWVCCEGRIDFWNTDIGTEPTTSELDAIEEKAKDAWMMRHIRKIRNKKLSETDWWSGSDLTLTADQIAYRKALRDFPATVNPIWVEEPHGISNVTWPTKP